MNRINQILENFASAAPKAASLATVFFCLTLGSGKLYAQQYFHNWTSALGESSYAGTITIADPGIGFAYGENESMPAITNTAITSGFNNGGNIGDSITFTFSAGYQWGKGGQMIIGNIHNYFQYTLSAWDFNGNPIDVNQWTTVAEYPYTWTPASKTNRAASGSSSNFFVHDPAADPASGQGGVLWLEGLKNVGTMTLTLTNNAVPPTPSYYKVGADFILFNVATPQHETCQPVKEFNGDLLKTSIWDNNTCYIKQVVPGATPFIWNNMYYVTADKIHHLRARRRYLGWRQLQLHGGASRGLPRE